LRRTIAAKWACGPTFLARTATPNGGLRIELVATERHFGHADFGSFDLGISVRRTLDVDVDRQRDGAFFANPRAWLGV
jgi:hypothetical protein